MSIWSKMITALRGGAHEIGENMLDGQALRILDQEIRDADTQLRQSKAALAEIMAKQKLAQNEVKVHSEKIAEYEQYAVQALEADNEVLALEVAEKIAKLEVLHTEANEQLTAYTNSVQQLQKSVLDVESHIKRLKQQADTVRATDSVQKAQMSVSKSFDGSQAKVHTALESLEKIKKQQAERAAKFEAQNELHQMNAEDDALNDKLREAGIVPAKASASSVLSRLKAKQQNTDIAN